MGLFLWLCLQSPAELAERLRSDRIEEREAAASALLSAGSGAREVLTPLVEDSDAEVSLRARGILETLELRSRLDPRLLAALPSLERELRGDNDNLRCFLEGTPGVEGSFEVDEGWASWALLAVGPFLAGCESLLGRADLEALACRALGDLTEDAVEAGILELILQKNLQSTIPELRRLIRAEGAELRKQAVQTLGAFEQAEALPELVASLGDSEESVVEGAAEAVRRVGPGLASELLQDLLLGDLPVLGRRRTLALLVLGGKGGMDEIFRAHLRHADEAVRWQAMECLVSVAADRCIEDVEALLDDPEARIRVHALDALVRLESCESAPAMLKLLKDPSTAVRQSALMALARLGDASAAEEIVPLLQDRELRPVAIHALLSLDALRSLPEILKYEKDPDPYVQAQVYRALGRFGD